jgi:hypothetical protein
VPIDIQSLPLYNMSPRRTRAAPLLTGYLHMRRRPPRGGRGTSRGTSAQVVPWSMGDHTSPRGGEEGRGVVLNATSGRDRRAVLASRVATIPPRAYHLGLGAIPPRLGPIPPHRPEIPPQIPPPIPPQKRWYWGQAGPVRPGSGVVMCHVAGAVDRRGVGGTSRRDLRAVLPGSLGDHTPPRCGEVGRGVVLKATSDMDLAVVLPGPAATIPPLAYHLGLGRIPPRLGPIPPHRPEIPPQIPPQIPPPKRWYWGAGWGRTGAGRPGSEVVMCHVAGCAATAARPSRRPRALSRRPRGCFVMSCAPQALQRATRGRPPPPGFPTRHLPARRRPARRR